MRFCILLELFLCQVLAQTKLHFVLTFVSQGTITPKHAVPSFDWEKWEEKGPDELTAMGMREQYLLGHELRRRYLNDNLIDFEYVIDQVQINMTDYNYTIMSGQAFIRGFLGNSLKNLNANQMKVADPPFSIEQYFKDKIGTNVLPVGIATLPFHTYYPHNEDVLSPLSCPRAAHVNAKDFDKDPNVKKAIETYEKDFLDLIKKHYGISSQFPAYVSLLESIASAIHQLKETSLNEKEERCVKEFSRALYYPNRTANKDANMYKLSGLFNYTKLFVNESIRTILNNTSRKQNLKAAFIFTSDTMLASILSLYNRTESFPPLGPANIIRFEVHGPNNPTIDNLHVKVLKDDELIMKYDNFGDFMTGIARFIKEDHSEWCVAED